MVSVPRPVVHGAVIGGALSLGAHPRGFDLIDQRTAARALAPALGIEQFVDCLDRGIHAHLQGFLFLAPDAALVIPLAHQFAALGG